MAPGDLGYSKLTTAGLLASRQRQPDLGVGAPITTADWAIWVSAGIAEPAA
jgi:hypothetical protein